MQNEQTKQSFTWEQGCFTVGSSIRRPAVTDVRCGVSYASSSIQTGVAQAGGGVCNIGYLSNQHNLYCKMLDPKVLD